MDHQPPPAPRPPLDEKERERRIREAMFLSRERAHEQLEELLRRYFR